MERNSPLNLSRPSTTFGNISVCGAIPTILDAITDGIEGESDDFRNNRLKNTKEWTNLVVEFTKDVACMGPLHMIGIEEGKERAIKVIALLNDLSANASEISHRLRADTPLETRINLSSPQQVVSQVSAQKKSQDKSQNDDADQVSPINSDNHVKPTVSAFVLSAINGVFSYGFWSIADYMGAHGQPVAQDVFYYFHFVALWGMFVSLVYQFWRSRLIMFCVWCAGSVAISVVMFPHLGAPMVETIASRTRFILPLMLTFAAIVSWILILMPRSEKSRPATNPSTTRPLPTTQTNSRRCFPEEIIHAEFGSPELPGSWRDKTRSGGNLADRVKDLFSQPNIVVVSPENLDMDDPGGAKKHLRMHLSDGTRKTLAVGMVLSFDNAW